MASKFKAAVTCPVCGHTVKANGITVDFTNDEGIVLLDLFANESFECERCGTVIYVGDVEQMYEYEEGSSEIDEDDDD